ncbi:zinc finger protein ZAT8-like [Panicum virgatum]|uniref:C2H2-type domain-containing protein n=1 Tax=Panicum virgatum TaxID=38727 RepID=A0A8T0TTP2_PANVG|nr:zinc finger protein ZAT8-like [Panicum virgatum]KAG2611209.1 hypothetical protein PVAP13_4KG125000 [Panicum virgatum]
MATTTARSTPEFLKLYLSLSTASKVIAKGAGGRRNLMAAAGGGAFRCRTCGRQFATFQALGGHRTSHNRPRVRADGLELLLGARPGKGAAASDVHRCNSCGMVFPTGQALGGHMRRHRAAAFDAAAAPMEEGDSESDDAGQHLMTNHTLFQFI